MTDDIIQRDIEILKEEFKEELRKRSLEELYKLRGEQYTNKEKLIEDIVDYCDEETLRERIEFLNSFLGITLRKPKITLEGARLKVILLAHTPEPEKLVAQAAKLCYSPASIEDLRETIARTDQEKFIRKLLSMGHMSPVEHISFTFGVEGISRACTHQLVRHRVASYSQQSQRYVSKDAKKTGKPFEFIIPPSIIEAGKKEWFVEKMLEVQRWYDELVEALGDKGESTYEDARFLLPNAAETKIIITMNARELLHFFRVRCCNRAQWEIREMAIEMLRQVKGVVPSIFNSAGPACVRGSCSEGPLTCGKIEEVRARFKGLTR